MMGFRRAGLMAGASFKIGSVTVNAGGVFSSTPSISFTDGGGGSGAAATANMATGYNGGNLSSIYGSQDGGYYSMGSALPTVTVDGIAGLATPVWGSGTVVALEGLNSTIVNSQSATVTLSGGGGSGAAIAGTISQPARLKVVGVSVASGGSGYTVAPSVVFTRTYSGVGSHVTDPVAVANISGGQVVSITVTTQGEYTAISAWTFGIVGYTVALSGGNGTGASVGTYPNVQTLEWYLYGEFGGKFLNGGGSGYTSAPTVTVSNLVSGGVTALVGRRIASITVNTAQFFSSQPVVAVSGGTAVGNYTISHSWYASGSWSTYQRVNSITVTNPGTGYRTTPAVVFTGGGLVVNPSVQVNMIPQ
jgi:hypothetical protein